jgi:hypothetical protein
MIPSTTNRLLVTEDWKKIYQSYRNADFKSYDFDTLKRTMITYLRENYPEDFNDFIDSSEYIALIDLIAYLGQNISFRVDLNARENFLETAQRRDSVLRLARLINYNSRRNVPASGILKILSVQSTDNVFDNNGINLANSVVAWNDPTNSAWFEQFVSVLNAAMPSGSSFGKPVAKAVINNVSTEKYQINTDNNGVPVYGFTKNINGSQMSFEVVSGTFDDSIKEEDPRPGNAFSLLYRNDNRGNSSSNTGFFVYFKQGTLNVSNFSIDNPVPNEVIGINASNINDSDVWLWQLNPDGSYPVTPWTQVSSISGNNVIYNNLSENNRNLYAVTSREDDQIDLNFADGSFGNLPKGNFRLFYRQSNGLTYSIKPEQLRNITVNISYVNAVGQAQTLKIFASLQYPVSNSFATESSNEIKRKAPQVYYSQNRMVTGEDYNIVPLTAGSDILKVKTINRLSSGVSKYYEMSDVTGKYSNINIYANDGILYAQDKEYQLEYAVTNKNEILNVVSSHLSYIFSLKEFRSFYLQKYVRPSLRDFNVAWNSSTQTTNQTTGYFKIDGIPTSAGEFASNNLKYSTPGSLIKFVAPKKINLSIPGSSELVQTYFLPNGKLTFVQDQTTFLTKWSKVVSVVTDGYNNGKGNLSTGIGPVTLTGKIPSEAVPVEIIPKFTNSVGLEIENLLVNLSAAKKNFGISLNPETSEWFIVSDTNIDLISSFSTIHLADATDANRDASWMIAFVWTGKKYVMRYRVLEYIFESERETSFFVEPYKINYDYLNDSVIKDKISILGINSKPAAISGEYLKEDQLMQIDSAIIEVDGFQDPKKVKVSCFDRDNDGQIDDPDAFINIVNPESTSTQTTFKDKFIYFETLNNDQYILNKDLDVFACPSELQVPQAMLTNGQLFYFYNSNVIKSWSTDLVDFILQPKYFAKSGRSNLKFHYEHKATEDKRIDPSKTNLMDIYLLTNSYDNEFRNWIKTSTADEPMAPTSESLGLAYSSKLNQLKSISDELIFHPTNYKVLFGDKAAPMLQATFKASKNVNRANSDNDLKTRILSAIDSFFQIENWDFGQTFYFSELATYVMNLLTPDINNFIIVPKQENSFGSLYEIKCQSNEIFVSGATIFDIEIINSVTTTEIKATGNVINSVGGQV